MRRREFIHTRITPEDRILIEKLARAMGMNLSEFLRYLIVKEFEEKGIIAKKIKAIKEEIKDR